MKRQLVITAMGLLAARFAHADVRNTGGFHAVELKGVVSVEVKLDSATRVEVTGDADVIKQVSTEVKNGSLIVDTHGNFNSHNKLVVTITTPTLDAIALSGTGSLRASGVKAGAFAIALSGTGQIDVTGSADNLAVELGGSGALHAKDLAAKAVTVNASGTGNVAVTATEALTASLSGVGSVDVYGHPKSVTKNVTGVGRIKLR